MSNTELILSPIGKKYVPYQFELEASAKLQADIDANETYEELINRLAKDNTIRIVPGAVAFNVQQFTTDNIGQFLNPVVDISISRKDAFLRLTNLIITTFDQIKIRAGRNHMIIIMMTNLIGYLDIMNDPALASFSVMIKGKFNNFIRCEKVYELIPIYNIIYNDNAFANIDTVPEVMITQAEIDAHIVKYNADLITYAEKNIALRPRPMYEKGEIIGAKNNEGKWYMAEVLKVFQHKHINMYYVEFKGWGDQFNEFIIDSFRLKRFNPRAHVYYRPAWKRHRQASVSTKEQDATIRCNNPTGNE
jgi:hypothetical protein